MIEKKAADPKRKCTKTQVAERKNRDPSLTKNGQSPQEAGGHTAKKGKGKGQKGGKASGKGKGKSKNKAEQKGKGKGAPSGAKSGGRGNGGIRKQKLVVITFWSFLANCTLYDLSCVFRSNELVKNITYFDSNSRSALVACSLPWPVSVTLGSYSKKHIFLASPVCQQVITCQPSAISTIR